jgi:branched-subunit amino acid transport protein AzlD
VYCLKDVQISQSPHGLPELIAILCAAGLHLWRRNVILSIAGATVFYMILIRVL